MPERIKVWPKPGLTVLDEHGIPYAPGGEVNRTRTVDRQILRGELLRQAPSGDAPAAPPDDAEQSGERTHVERFDDKGGKS